MLLAAWYPGMILGKIFSFAVGGILGLVAGMVIGWMLCKGVNPLKWVMDRFTLPK